jgi:hypothetical protein
MLDDHTASGLVVVGAIGQSPRLERNFAAEAHIGAVVLIGMEKSRS